MNSIFKETKVVWGINSGFIDFYGTYSITLFLCGCNLHCSYCYNMDIVQGEPKMTFQEVMKNLSNLQKVFPNNNKLHVVLSGGEPTFNEYFDYIIDELRTKYILGIHTNGLLIPKFDNMFEAVVLSLKSLDDGLRIYMDDYIDRISKAIDYYDSCHIKQIRIVRIPEQKKWMDEILSNLKDKTKSWNIKYVSKAIRKEMVAI